MNRFRNLIITAIGFSSLIAVGAITNPRNGYGSGGSSAAAPTSQTQNVNVVNTPTVSAQQSGVWMVGIAGTPTVGLDAANNTVKFDANNNTVKIDPAAPVPVRDADNPAGQPFAASCVINNNLGFPCTLTNVPQGKRLVVEMFQIGSGGGELGVTTNNVHFVWHIQPGEHVRAYADAGTAVTAAGAAQGLEADISGYLVNLP
ncbi:MAG TPA: hypothetical protein VFU37_11895 [Pyrinomonadaceae bacterium]|nr:hypothetical protein [Pyrinomonadaceae bacterium]